MSLDTRQSVIRRALFATLGALAVALAVVGVFVPGIPTTIFVIAASYLFARSSPACEAWLERSPLLGPPLRRFRETGGMPAKSKGVALVSMWTGVAVSSYALTAVSRAAAVATLGLGIVGTTTVLVYVRTTPSPPTGRADVAGGTWTAGGQLE